MSAQSKRKKRSPVQRTTIRFLTVRSVPNVSRFADSRARIIGCHAGTKGVPSNIHVLGRDEEIFQMIWDFGLLLLLYNKPCKNLNSIQRCQVSCMVLLVESAVERHSSATEFTRKVHQKSSPALVWSLFHLFQRSWWTVLLLLSHHRYLSSTRSSTWDPVQQ